MNTIWKVFRKRIEEIRVILILSYVMYFAALAVFSIIMKTTNEEETTFALGSAVMIGISVFFVLIYGTFGFATEFNMAIGMGITRKQFVPAYYITSLILIVIQTAIIYVSFLAERWYMKTMYSQYPYEKGVEYIFGSYVTIFGILALAAAQILLGSLTLKFGKKAYWGVWALWMIMCMLPGRIEKEMKNATGSILDKMGTGVVNFFDHITEVQGAIGLLLLTVIIVGISFYMTRKQQVSSL